MYRRTNTHTNTHIDRIYSQQNKQNTDNDYHTSGELMRKSLHHKEPYIFTVAAMNSAGTGDFSAPTDDFLPIIAPSITSYTAVSSQTSGTSANVSISGDTGGANISSISVVISTSGVSGSSTLNIDPTGTNTSSSNSTGFNYTSLTKTNTGSSGYTYTFTVTGLSNGTSYVFNTTVTNMSGLSSSSSVTTSTLNVPSAPTTVSAFPGQKKCTVTFKASTSSGGTDITGYTITSNPGNVSVTVSPPFTSTNITADITGLTPKTSYTFTVIATNKIGNSASSNGSIPVIPYDIPLMTGVTLSASSNENNQSTLTFTGQPDSNGSTILNYVISVTNPSSGITPVTITGSTLPSSYVFKGLTNGTSYTFSVTANNTAGSSSAITATATPAAKPTAPDSTKFTLSNDNNVIKIKFLEPSSNGSPITSYTVKALYNDTSDNNKPKYELVTVSSNSPNLSAVDSNGYRTLTLYTNKRYVANADILTSNPSENTSTKVLSLTPIQGYDYVPLDTYPVGAKRTMQISQQNTNNKCQMNSCNLLYILILLILILIFLRNILKK